MRHPSEEQLVEAYYSGFDSELQLHLETCTECTATYRNISEALGTAAEWRLPPRGDHYGTEVWTRLQPHLARANTKPALFPRWLFVPALAALLAAVFLAGRLAVHTPPAPLLQSIKLPASPQPKPAPLRRLLVARAPAHSDTRNELVVDVPSQRELTGLYASSSNQVVLEQAKDPIRRVSAVITLATPPERSAALTSLYRTDSSAQVRLAVLDALVAQQDRVALEELAREETDARRRSDILRRIYKLRLKQ